MPDRKTLPWILTLVIFAICSADDHGDGDKKDVHHWNYDKEGGPSRWGKIYPDECGEQKHRQSPVDVKTSQVLLVEDFDEINLSYQKTSEHNMTLFNNGHTVQVNVNGLVNIVGGGLGDSFRIFQLHFHWGAADDHGSEHKIDGKSFPLEMHMVSYDSNRYLSVQEAMGGFNSLAVLGTLFTVSEEDNPALEPIINALERVKHNGDSVVIPWIDPVAMIPTQTSHFFRYDGSLTTPPCLENVIWTVFSTQQTISKAQLQKFRGCFQEGDTGEEMPLVDNYRPPQPLHGRMIYSSFQPAKSTNLSPTDDSAIVTSSVVLILSMLAVLFL